MKKVCTRVIVVLRDRGYDLDWVGERMDVMDVEMKMCLPFSCSEKNYFWGVYLGGGCCDVKNKN